MQFNINHTHLTEDYIITVHAPYEWTMVLKVQNGDRAYNVHGMDVRNSIISLHDVSIYHDDLERLSCDVHAVKMTKEELQQLCIKASLSQIKILRM